MAAQSYMALTPTTTGSRLTAAAPCALATRDVSSTGRIGVISLRKWKAWGVSCTGGSPDSRAKLKGVPNSNYVVPLDNSSMLYSSSCITRPLVEILRDLNKRVPENIVKTPVSSSCSTSSFIPWYHANRMLSFYAPGWCGEVRDVIFSENGDITVVYRLTIRGSDGEAYREATGTVTDAEDRIQDPVAAAEEIAFSRACARFGLGLYLFHEE